MPFRKPDTYTDEDLIRGSIKGDRVFQKALFMKYAGVMLTVCRRFAGSEAEAEDLLQDGFVIVFSKLHQFKFQGSFEGWMRKIMVRNAIRALSRKNSNKELPLVSGIDSPHSACIVESMAAEEILTYIRELPEGYRLVFNLYVIEGYTHKEIAGMLEIQESSSRSQLVKARRYLQKKILEENKIII